MTTMRKRLIILATVGLCALLAACYLPNHFKSEIRLGSNGDYALSFYGELTWAPLYREITQGKLTPDQAKEKIDGIMKDLERDDNFTKIENLGNGRFKVAYERQGHLAATDMVTFVRRNAIVLQMVAKPDGRIIVSGNTLKPSDAQMATSSGMDIQGEFRIVTNGNVLEHNASAIKPYEGYLVYIWNIENVFSPAPRFVMRREGAYPAEKPKDKKK